MSIVTSGPISIQTLKNEFGSSANSLSSYYRAGGIVPNSGPNSGVPASGTISLGSFYGAASVIFALSATPSDFNGDYDSFSAAGSFSTTYAITAQFATGSVTGTWARIVQSGTAASSSVSGNSLTLAGSWPRRVLRSYSETWRFTGTDEASHTASVDVTLEVDVSADS